MADDVLIADRLDGRPLDGDHGAPVRLVSPSQYGYHSAKHLCRIELQTTAPRKRLGSATGLSGVFLHGLTLRHPRGRVWEEERHPHVPGRLLRHVYRPLIWPIRTLSARGSRRTGS